MIDYQKIRRKTRAVSVGGVIIGGNAKIAIQSMTNTDTKDASATIAQVAALEAAGCDIVRITVPDKESAKTITEIKKAGIKVPIVADIHFDYQAALACAERGVDKIRINPGNIGDESRVKAVVDACKQRSIPIRIGVNSGSLEKHILAKYGAPTPEALCESAMYHAALLEKYDFEDIVISIKGSSVEQMIKANRLVAERCSYPIHIGVTEAGSEEYGMLKSAAGIGALLCDGIGDTMRVSLTADPVKEVRAAKNILNALETYDVPALNLRVAELAHHIPHGIDCDHGLDTYQELMKQAHYWLRGDAAEVVWITPSHKTTDVFVTEKISVKFNGSISREQIDKVTVINREKGTVATGRWESKFGDTLWEFYPDALDGGYVYTVTVPDTIVDSVNGKALAAPKQISFRTSYEVTDAPTIVGENMHLTLTDSTSSGVYFLFDKIRESEKYLLRFQAENNAHNKVLVYTLCEIDRENLSESTCSAEPIGEILLSDEGYYELDVTGAVKAAEEEIGFYLALGKVEGQTIVYDKDFESSEVGNYKLPKDLYYEA